MAVKLVKLTCPCSHVSSTSRISLLIQTKLVRKFHYLILSLPMMKTKKVLSIKTGQNPLNLDLILKNFKKKILPSKTWV